MASKADELQLDIKELNTLIQQATRPKVKDILTLEARSLQTELAKLIDENKEVCMKPVKSSTDSAQKCYEVKLNNYGWDQTNSTVKLYVELKDVHQLPKEAVTYDVTERSVDIRVSSLDKKIYRLTVNNLCEDVDAEKSHIKIKTDMIVVYLTKLNQKHWSHITSVEKRISEAKTPLVPELEDNNDPGGNLMDLLKKMYDDADDEMKKSIAQAWAESH